MIVTILMMPAIVLGPAEQTSVWYTNWSGAHAKVTDLISKSVQYHNISPFVILNF
jgi:hypothetical protein